MDTAAPLQAPAAQGRRSAACSVVRRDLVDGGPGLHTHLALLAVGAVVGIVCVELFLYGHVPTVAAVPAAAGVAVGTRCAATLALWLLSPSARRRITDGR